MLSPCFPTLWQASGLEDIWKPIMRTPSPLIQIYGPRRSLALPALRVGPGPSRTPSPGGAALPGLPLRGQLLPSSGNHPRTGQSLLFENVRYTYGCIKCPL